MSGKIIGGAFSVLIVAGTFGLATPARAQPSYDEFGLRPDSGGDGQDVEPAWPEAHPDGARPESIAPDEEKLDPFDERVVDSEPAPRGRRDVDPAPPPAPDPEEVLPSVEELLKEGPGRPVPDPGSMEDEQRKTETDKTDPEEW